MAKNKYIDQRFFTNGRTSNLSLTNKLDLKKYIQQVSGNSQASIINSTYDELATLAGNNQLIPGQHYLITDFRTCYDQPDYDQYRNPIAVSNSSWVPTAIDPIVVLAVSETNLAPDAYQPSYPNDSIKYDVTYSTTESGNTAFGRITERIDEFGNRTDYDHHTITFKRYRLRTYNRLNPLAGTVDLKNDGTVLGVDTLFTSLTPGQVIAIRGSNETFYIILTITDDTTMTVTGEQITPTGAGFQIFSTNDYSYDSYYPNNVDGQLDFELYNTFEASASYGGDGCINTYIGDHATYYVKEGIGDFLLANNVLKDGRYENNTIGDSSYNNTFNDDCTANKIGYAFRNNITDDDFDSNVIGTFFENNIITANFNDNNIGNNFENNVIINSSLYRNQIGNDFRDNWLDGDWGLEFYQNQIGNYFNNNVIYKDFYNNVILNSYNNNQTWDEFYGNKIGNGFNDNEIYNRFYENQILDNFNNNIIGDSEDIGNFNFYNNIIGNDFKGNNCLGDFYGNHIGHDFVTNSTENQFKDNVIGNNTFSNNIDVNFGYNTIGFGFTNNTILNDFGYGGGQARGNKIGNEFQNNNIGEYFYDNTIADAFQNNTIGDYFTNNKIDYEFRNNSVGYNFRNNDIKVQGITFYGFAAAQGDIQSFSNNTPNGSDNTYFNLSPDESNSVYGNGATFDVTVTGGIVTSVIINAIGSQYQSGDQLAIYGAQFGGVTGVDDLFINVTGVSNPLTNRLTNCTIFRDEDTDIFMSYIDNAGVLQVVPVPAVTQLHAATL